MTIDGALFRFIPKYDRSVAPSVVISKKLLDLKLDGNIDVYHRIIGKCWYEISKIWPKMGLRHAKITLMIKFRQNFHIISLFTHLKATRLGCKTRFILLFVVKSQD